MAKLDDIKPTAPHRVIDLVRSAGVDVSDWKNFKDGLVNERKASVNPKYCYEWAFIEPNKVIAINLWYKELTEENGQIFQTYNYRKIADTLGRKGVWKKRALKVDAAIRHAFENRLPVRVIICDGDMQELKDKASEVNNRLLDPALWAVTAYDFNSGQYTLTRGIALNRLKDQFSFPDYDSAVTERRSKTGEVYVRRPEVRESALLRAKGKCEYCLEQGFILPDGSIFLETHHIIPLSEGGIDTPDNVAALCPNHHREAHLGKRSRDINSQLLNLRKLKPNN